VSAHARSLARAHTLADFDFDLPDALIAQRPALERSASRLLDGTGDAPVDRVFRSLPDLLRPGDLLVFNDTQVVKARLYGVKPTGGAVELLIERVLDAHSPACEVAAHMKASKKPPVGTVLAMDGGFEAELLGRWPYADGALFRFRLSADAYELMAAHGHVPLPPYITHDDDATDERRYQTVFAKHPGAVAAPTAALHFDEALLAELDARGIERATITLHVGAGTFQPVKTERIEDHKMHAERYYIDSIAMSNIAGKMAKKHLENGPRIVAVGTTTVRTLETWARTQSLQGDTDIFITPGFDFRVVDMLVTNFHLPKSTLMMLVSAFAGYEHIMSLYAHAIRERYRFFSYGDAMLLARR
jgi:S-adenosylmethionine:tRNA ribosyltransferase-isomerase